MAVTICTSQSFMRNLEKILEDVYIYSLSLDRIMTTCYIPFPEPNVKRLFCFSFCFLFQHGFLFFLMSVLSHFNYKKKKKVPSKSPSLAFAASSEDDILS